MPIAQSAIRGLLATQGRTYSSHHLAFVRSYTPGPVRSRTAGRRGQHGDSIRSPRSKERSHIPRRSRRQPRLFAPDQRRDQLSPKELTVVITQELSKVQKQLGEPEFQQFKQNVVSALSQSLKPSREAAPVVDSLRHSFIEQGHSALRSQIKYAYHGYLSSQRLSKSNLQDQARIADIRYPVEWYPATRQMQRTIHLHVGPTNSGKTHHALQRLEQARSGLYAGPLRLLAHEVYTRLNARGRPCNLITGDERQLAEAGDVSMCSCTVEMVPVNQTVDIAVIDEIQMIGHEQRGWAWTQAVLGLKAKELHLCGEERTVPLIRELAAAMGDDLQIHHYQRLSPLKTMSASLKGDLGNLRKGDCVVAFSKLHIYRLKKKIELKTRKPVAVVYGSLPPEVRAQQAGLFNDPNNDYDILVASDAIGMGLNLSIKRIIFATVFKFNGRTEVPVEVSQIKQIAGRAGRYRTAAQAADQKTSENGLSGTEAKGAKVSPVVSSAQNLGLVTTLSRAALSTVQTAMESQAGPIMTAGLFPPVDVLVRFAAYFPPATPFNYILLRLHNTSILHPRFHLCSLDEHLEIADIIEPVRNLTISDRVIFCASPASTQYEELKPVLRAFAECVGNNSGGGILDIKALNLELLDVRFRIGSREHLHNLECLHKAVILYLWLSYHFAGVFNTQAMAFYLKRIVEERIQQALSVMADTTRNIESSSTKRSVQQGHEIEHPGANNANEGFLDDEQSMESDQSPHLTFSGNIQGEGVKNEIVNKSEVEFDFTIPSLTPNRESLSRGSVP